MRNDPFISVVSLAYLFYIGLLLNLNSFPIEVSINFPLTKEKSEGDIKFRSGKCKDEIGIKFLKENMQPFITFMISPVLKDNELAESELVGKKTKNPLFRAVYFELGAEDNPEREPFYWFISPHPRFFLFLIETPVKEVEYRLIGEMKNLLLMEGMLTVKLDVESVVVCPISPEAVDAKLEEDINNPVVRFTSNNKDQGKLYGFIFFISPPITPKIFYSPSDFGYEHGFCFSLVNPYAPSSTCDFFIPEKGEISAFRKGEFLIWGKLLYQLGEYGQYSKLGMFNIFSLAYRKETTKWQLIFDTPFTGSVVCRGRLSNIGSAVLNGTVNEPFRYIPVRCIIEKDNGRKEEIIFDVPKMENYQLFRNFSPNLEKKLR